MDRSRERDALMKANEISSIGNKFLQEKEPWIMIKENEKGAGEIIAQCIDLFKVLVVLYNPFVPTASKKLADSINFDLNEGFEGIFGSLKEGTKVKNIGILFEKLEKEKIEKLKNKFGGKK